MGVCVVITNNNTNDSDVAYEVYHTTKELANILRSKGIINVNASNGLKCLIGKVLDIPQETTPTLTGISFNTSVSINVTESVCHIGDTIHITGVLSAFRDDISDSNIDVTGRLSNATIEIYDGGDIIDTVTTDNNGEYSLTYTVTDTDVELFVLFEGNNDYIRCSNSRIVNVLPYNQLLVSSDKGLVSSYHNDSCTISVELTDNNDEIVELSDVPILLHIGSSTVSRNTTNGLVEYTYTATGTGDVNITASTNGLVSNNITIEDVQYFNDGSSLTGLDVKSGVSCTLEDGYIRITTSTSGEKFVYPPVCYTGSDNWEASFQCRTSNYNSQAFGFQMENCGTTTYSGDSQYTAGYPTSLGNCMGQGNVNCTLTDNDTVTFRRLNGSWIILVNDTVLVTRSYSWSNSRVPGFYTNQGRVQYLKNLKYKRI
jgi:hypothetical protein